jgi:hypothetical protein
LLFVTAEARQTPKHSITASLMATNQSRIEVENHARSHLEVLRTLQLELLPCLAGGIGRFGSKPNCRLSRNLFLQNDGQINRLESLFETTPQIHPSKDKVRPSFGPTLGAIVVCYWQAASNVESAETSAPEAMRDLEGELATAAIDTYAE